MILTFNFEVEPEELAEHIRHVLKNIQESCDYKIGVPTEPGLYVVLPRYSGAVENFRLSGYPRPEWAFKIPVSGSSEDLWWCSTHSGTYSSGWMEDNFLFGPCIDPRT